MRSLCLIVVALLFEAATAQSSNPVSLTSPSPATSSAFIVPNASAYGYLGCYNETTGDSATGNARALAGGTMVHLSTSVSDFGVLLNHV